MFDFDPSDYFFLTITKIVGSFAQAHCFPRAVAYLDSGRIKVKGMVCVPAGRSVYPGSISNGLTQITDVFGLSEYQNALDKMNSRAAVKIVVKPQA